MRVAYKSDDLQLELPFHFVTKRDSKIIRYIYIYICHRSVLFNLRVFNTELKKTYWLYMKILSKNTNLLTPTSKIPPFHILFTPLFHFFSLFVSFHSFFRYSFPFYSILFHLVHSASFHYISYSFRIHFA